MGGSLRDLSKNILKQGVVKAKVVHRGEGVLKVSPPLPPQKILIIHFGSLGPIQLIFRHVRETFQDSRQVNDLQLLIAWGSLPYWVILWLCGQNR